MFLLTAALAAEVHPTARELTELAWVTTPRVSPDGQTLLFASGGQRFDPDAGPDDPGEDDAENGWTGSSQLYTLSVDGGTPRQLTTGDEAPFDAFWSPDGRSVLFQRDEATWLLPIDGGEARKLELDPEAHHVRFSPDGKALRYLAAAEPDEDEANARFQRGEAHRFEVADHDRLYTVDLTGGVPVALTDGTDHVVAFSESSTGVFALTVASENNAYETAIHPKLKLLDDGETTALEGTCIESVRWSPRGRSLAWAGCRTGGITDGLYVWDGKQTTNVLEHADPTLTQVRWADEKTLIAGVVARTESEIWRVPAGGGSHQVAYAGGVVRGLELGPVGRKLYTRLAAPNHALQVTQVDLKTGRERSLWDPNPQVAEWGSVTPEVFAWESPEAAIDGLLYTPAGDGPHKLLVMPHGGPDGVSMQGYDGWAQFFAARGYAVLRPNYRGGIGYGREFYAANRGRLGPIEFMDIEAGVDALIERGTVDADQLYYGGWSWGGYLTTWAIGHTDRYRAAMAGAAVTDTQAQYVGSDINHGTIGDWEFRGRPWKDWERYDSANPRRHVTSITTPTLILHGDADARVPFDQGVTLYRALSDLGVEVEFWVYPNEGHGLREPPHQVHRLETWLSWLESH